MLHYHPWYLQLNNQHQNAELKNLGDINRTTTTPSIYFQGQQSSKFRIHEEMKKFRQKSSLDKGINLTLPKVKHFSFAPIFHNPVIITIYNFDIMQSNLQKDNSTSNDLNKLLLVFRRFPGYSKLSVIQAYANKQARSFNLVTKE